MFKMEDLKTYCFYVKIKCFETNIYILSMAAFNFPIITGDIIANTVNWMM